MGRAVVRVPLVMRDMLLPRPMTAFAGNPQHGGFLHVLIRRTGGMFEPRHVAFEAAERQRS